MLDLLEIHIRKIQKNKLSISPARWCGKHGLYLESLKFGSDDDYMFMINGQLTNRAFPSRDYVVYQEQLGQYLATEYAANVYEVYEPTGAEIEEAYRAQYVFNNPETEIEVTTPVGRIDCLTDTELVEIKSVKKWKAALGQLLSYGFYYPQHKKVLLLYGDIEADKKSEIDQICKFYHVELRTC